MSSSREIFVGWYIRATKSYTVNNETYYTCEYSLSHKVKSEYNNCPECGGSVIDKIRKERVALTIYDLPDEVISLEDQFYYPEYILDGDSEEVILISNRNAGCYINSDFADTGFIADVSAERQAKQFSGFMQEHEHDIELLKTFIYDDVKVLYGVFDYYM